MIKNGIPKYSLDISLDINTLNKLDSYLHAKSLGKRR